MSIRDALIKFEYKEPTIDIIAKYNGFSEAEVKMMELFWSDNFNENWIYLSDEMILTNMTNETKKNALSNFYTQVLFTNFTIDVDYKEIKKDDDLIKKYNEVFDSLNLINQKNKVKMTTKKYYAVTGETYKELLKIGSFRKTKQIVYNEKIIADKLSKTLNGVREVYINETKQRIDILTDDEIIEVKSFKCRMAAVGQILYYHNYYNNRKMRIHLFENYDERDTVFEKICANVNIAVTYD